MAGQIGSRNVIRRFSSPHARPIRRRIQLHAARTISKQASQGSVQASLAGSPIPDTAAVAASPSRPHLRRIAVAGCSSPHGTTIPPRDARPVDPRARLRLDLSGSDLIRFVYLTRSSSFSCSNCFCGSRFVRLYLLIDRFNARKCTS